MPGTEKNSIQRLKILYLYKIMLEQTDELHPITMSEIINQLKLCGISAERKALYQDIEALCTFGLDIKQLKGNTSVYYVASREFELPELKLRFSNDLINPVLDRFGKDITIVPDGDENFTVHVKVKAEAPFFAWLFQFGKKAKIVEPEELKTKYMVHLNEVLETMK